MVVSNFHTMTIKSNELHFPIAGLLCMENFDKVDSTYGGQCT